MTGTQPLAIAAAVAIGVLLIVGVATLALTVMLNGKVAALEDQARKMQKATKAMQEELAGLRERMPPPVAPAAAAAPAALRPGNIDAADPAHDCVIGSGEKGGVARCMGLPAAGAERR